MSLEIKNLSVSYYTNRGEIKAVNDVSLDIRKGETVGIVGESGSGKSTLGLSIIRLVQAPGRIKQGSVIFEAQDLPYLPEEELRRIRGKKIAVVFQDPMTSLNPVMNIHDHFLEVLRTHEPEIEEDSAEERIERLLKELAIPSDRLKDYPHQFSGGMRQRVMIGLALILNPDILIADEPTTALDVIVEAQILDLLGRLKEAYNLTLILITHNIGIIAETCDRVAVMYAGSIAEVSDVNEIFQQPRHPYTQLLLRSVPNVKMDEQSLRWISGSPPDLAGPPSGCRFHPRCPFAFERCVEIDPPLFNVGEKTKAACHLYG